MKFIHSEQAPKAIGPYSQAVWVENTLYVSGQLPLDLESMQICSEDVFEQTKKCLDHIDAILKASGLSKDHVVKCSVYMTDLSKFSQMNEAYQAFFSQHKPARIAIEVSRLPKDACVEIDAIAVKV